MRACLVASLIGLAGCDHAVDIGAFSAIWSVSRDGTAADCEQLALSSVEVYAVAADETAYATQFPCALGEGLTSYMPPDDYRVTIRLLDREREVVAAGPPLAVRLYLGRVVELASIRFDLP